MKNKSTITLDITLDGLKDPVFIAYLEANDITFHVLNWNGPGGGNPEVQFFGTGKSLEAMARVCYESGDREQDDYVVSLIKPARS
jgi:hypothetical protein